MSLALQGGGAHGAFSWGVLDYLLEGERIHMIGDGEGMKALGVTSKFNTEHDFLEHLKAAGRASAERWLEGSMEALGVRSSVDVRRAFL